MPRMKRKDVLTAIRAAGYHGDKERGILLYIQNWVSLSTFGREYEAGAVMRQNGLPCDCLECRPPITNLIWDQNVHPRKAGDLHPRTSPSSHRISSSIG